MSCSYYEFREGSYYCLKKHDYINSDVYERYCRSYNYDECPIYLDHDSSGECYITSACIYAKGLQDNCYELETLREYRDEWLSKQPGGKDLIKNYYAIAPKIVSCINERENKNRIYNAIYDHMVKPCVELIEQKKYTEAKELYKNMTEQLKKQYI